MGKKLETCVTELIRLGTTKKAAGKTKYNAEKAYDNKYNDTFEMLEAGQKMPKSSKYFAGIVEEPKGYVTLSYVVERLVENHPRLAKEVEQYKQDCREDIVEKLSYGKIE